MSDKCKCGSYAINPHHHGRNPAVDLDLCDVCYWRKRATAQSPAVRELVEAAIDALWWVENSNEQKGRTLRASIAAVEREGK